MIEPNHEWLRTKFGHFQCPRGHWLSTDLLGTDGKYTCAECDAGRDAAPPQPSLANFWPAHAEWSQATFGTDAERGPIGPLKHLEKEAREAQADPTDLEEFADCLFLTFDATRRAGFTLEQLTAACFAKLAKNKTREWGPRTKDGAVEHVRSTPEAQPVVQAAEQKVEKLERQLAAMTRHKDAAQYALTNMQKHRDAWRGYAYGNRPKPDDFLDGNMTQRGVTAIESAEARAAELLDRVETWRLTAENLSLRKAGLERQLAEVLDILWRDIDGLRDPKLPVVQVAAKAANAIHWRNESIKSLDLRATGLERQVENLKLMCKAALRGEKSD